MLTRSFNIQPQDDSQTNTMYNTRYVNTDMYTWILALSLLPFLLTSCLMSANHWLFRKVWWTYVLMLKWNPGLQSTNKYFLSNWHPLLTVRCVWFCVLILLYLSVFNSLSLSLSLRKKIRMRQWFSWESNPQVLCDRQILNHFKTK